MPLLPSGNLFASGAARGAATVKRSAGVPNQWPGMQADPIVGAGPPGTGLHRTQSGKLVNSAGFYQPGPDVGTQTVIGGGPIEPSTGLHRTDPSIIAGGPAAVKNAINVGNKLANTKPIVVTNSYPTTPDVKKNTVVIPNPQADTKPDLGPSYYPKGFQHATGGPAPKSGGGGGGGGAATVPLQLIDASWLLGDDKNLTALTKAVSAALNIDYTGLSKTATKSAKAAVAQNVAELVRQQQAIRAQGNRLGQAYDIGSQATAALSANIPDVLRQNYNAAAQVMGGLSRGFAGDVASTAAAQAGAIPAQGGVAATSTESLAGLPNALGTQIYAAGGQIPGGMVNPSGVGGTGLLGAGAGLAAQAATLPSLIRASGVQGALMARGAGAAEAAKLLPDIQAQQAKLPGLISSTYQDLVGAAQKGADMKVNALSNLAKMTTLSPYQRASLWTQVQGINERTIASAMKAGATGKGFKPTVITDGLGKKWVMDWTTGKLTPLPLPGKPASTTGGATAAGLTSLSKFLVKASRGGFSWHATEGQPFGQFLQDPNSPPMDYQQAVSIVMNGTQKTFAQAAQWAARLVPAWQDQYAKMVAAGLIPGVKPKKITVTQTYPGGAPSATAAPPGMRLGPKTLA